MMLQGTGADPDRFREFRAAGTDLGGHLHHSTGRAMKTGFGGCCSMNASPRVEENRAMLVESGIEATDRKINEKRPTALMS